MIYSTEEEQLMASILRDDFLEQRRSTARKCQHPRNTITAPTPEMLGATAKAVAAVKMNDTNTANKDAG